MKKHPINLILGPMIVWTYLLLCGLTLSCFSQEIISNDGLDDTQAIQSFINLQKNPTTASFKTLPAGRLTITDSLKIEKSMGYLLKGAGSQNRSPSTGWDNVRTATIFDWKGPKDRPILILEGFTSGAIEGINFTGEASQGILIKHGVGSLNIRFEDLGFLHQTVGIQVGTTQGEQTCANITYDNCHFEQMKEACVRIINLQSLEHLFIRPQLNFSPIGIDVQGGGDVSILSGGSYELGNLLKLGNGGRNTRGFDVTSFRFDSKANGTRTAWLDFANPNVAKTYGPITFRNCTTNNGQTVSSKPVITVAPGSRVVVRESSFDGNLDNWAKVISDNRANAELIVENSDGLDGANLVSYVTTIGNRAYYSFSKVGTLYGVTGSLSNFPEDFNEHTHDDILARIKAIGDLFPALSDALIELKNNPILTLNSTELEKLQSIDKNKLNYLLSLDTEKLNKLMSLDEEKLRRAIEIAEKVAEIQ